MRKIFIADDQGKETESGVTVHGIKPTNLEELKEGLSQLSLHHELVQVAPNRYKVMVQENAGTNAFYAQSLDDKHWLSATAYKMEKKAAYFCYHYKF